MRMKKLERTILIIFGSTGDLSRRKLLPALFRLEKSGLLPDGFHILAISRRGTTVDDIISIICATVPEASGETVVLESLGKRMSILDMDIGKPQQYGRLSEALSDLEKEAGNAMNHLFYLAIPATLFETVTGRMGEPDINRHEPGIRECRFLIEKPFGFSLDSARQLIDSLGARFDQSQIYRIDHYLAKETAQNILAFRFENPLFCGTWNREHISHIMITAIESIGIEGRAAFYDSMGAMRDLVQSHLLQLLALVTMRQPRTFSDTDIHREKEYILSRVRPPRLERMNDDTIRAQYRGYRNEAGNPASMTETYTAVRLSIDDEAWKDVPIFIRTGKALAQKVTEVTIVFSNPCNPSRNNLLTIRIQPNEGIVIDLRIKKPGFDMAYEDVQLDFCYTGTAIADHPEAYERVLVDGMRGDRTLFASDAEVLSCWKITEPILEAWKNPDFPMHFYDEGSWGPQAADQLVEKSGIPWLTDEHPVCTPPRIVHHD